MPVRALTRRRRRRPRLARCRLGREARARSQRRRRRDGRDGSRGDQPAGRATPALRLMQETGQQNARPPAQLRAARPVGSDHPTPLLLFGIRRPLPVSTEGARRRRARVNASEPGRWAQAPGRAPVGLPNPPALLPWLLEMAAKRRRERSLVKRGGLTPPLFVSCAGARGRLLWRERSVKPFHYLEE